MVLTTHTVPENMKPYDLTVSRFDLQVTAIPDCGRNPQIETSIAEEEANESKRRIWRLYRRIQPDFWFIEEETRDTRCGSRELALQLEGGHPVCRLVIHPISALEASGGACISELKK
jgi:hypothetical protein